MSLSCNIVEDVCVLYQDGALSDATRREVEDHLAGCRSCTDYYREMAASCHAVPRARRVPQEPYEATLEFESLAQKLRRSKIRNTILYNSAYLAALAAGVLLTRRALLPPPGKKHT